MAKLPPPTHTTPDLAAKWYEESLGKIPSCGTGWNPYQIKLARAAKRAGVDLQRLVQDVVAHTPGGVPDGRLPEIERAYDRCDLTAAPRSQYAAPRVKRTPPSVELPEGLSSPTIKQLETLFKPDEIVVIAPGHYNKEKERDEPCDCQRTVKVYQHGSNQNVPLCMRAKGLMLSGNTGERAYGQHVKDGTTTRHTRAL